MEGRSEWTQPSPKSRKRSKIYLRYSYSSIYDFCALIHRSPICPIAFVKEIIYMHNVVQVTKISALKNCNVPYENNTKVRYTYLYTVLSLNCHSYTEATATIPGWRICVTRRPCGGPQEGPQLAVTGDSVTAPWARRRTTQGFLSPHRRMLRPLKPRWAAKCHHDRWCPRGGERDFWKMAMKSLEVKE